MIYGDDLYGRGTGSNDCMTCPLLIAGPDVPENEIKCAKSADTSAIALEMLGQKAEEEFGVSNVDIS